MVHECESWYQSVVAMLSALKNLRILEAQSPPGAPAGWVQARSLRDGLLVQSGDDQLHAELKSAHGEVGEEQKRDLLFSWTVCKHVRSNAIVLAKN